MNIGTLIGFIVGILLLLVSLMMSVSFNLAKMLWYADMLSLVVVLGGVVSAAFISYPFKEVMGVADSFAKAMAADELPVADYISQIEELSGDAMKGGFGKLSGAVDDAGNYFMEDGLRMVVDKYPAEEIRSIMTDTIRVTHQREMKGAKMIKEMGKNAPAFGVVGTLMGLVVMMKSLNADDPNMLTSLGGGMGTALLTTFYGVLFSNFFFGPIAIKVEKRIEERIMLMTIIMEGTLLILEKTPPAMVRDKLKVYLPPKKWGSIKNKGE